jgi:chromate reductase
MMQQPEAYVGGADKLFDAEGKLTVQSTRDFMTKFMQAYETWIDRFVVK